MCASLNLRYEVMCANSNLHYEANSIFLGLVCASNPLVCAARVRFINKIKQTHCTLL